MAYFPWVGAFWIEASSGRANVPDLFGGGAPSVFVYAESGAIGVALIERQALSPASKGMAWLTRATLTALVRDTKVGEPQTAIDNAIMGANEYRLATNEPCM